MTARLSEFLADREQRTLRMRDALREVGFDLDEAEIEARIAAGKPIGRPTSPTPCCALPPTSSA